MLFVVPVVFFLGFGLLVLRLYPVLMTGLSALAARLPGIVWQLTLRRLARTTGQFLSLLVLVVVTVAMGIFNASAARTLKRNFEDRIRYEIGADLVVLEQWRDAGAGETGEALAREAPRPRAASEPPWIGRVDLPGVAAAARVLMRVAEVRQGTRVLRNVRMQALVPEEFAATAWSRPDLFAAPFRAYLGALAREPEGVLVSKEFADGAGLAPGDSLTLNYADQLIDTYVLGTVAHWPALDPARGPFVVANLHHIQSVIALEPYESW
jgi:putative ABC transport system permease protein